MSNFNIEFYEILTSNFFDFKNQFFYLNFNFSILFIKKQLRFFQTNLLIYLENFKIEHNFNDVTFCKYTESA